MKVRSESKVAAPSFFQRIDRNKLILILLSLIVAGFLISFGFARAAGELSVEILAGYNLVVDSNITATSTFAPEVATIAARVCNTTGGVTAQTIQNIELNIGNYIDGVNDTPGIYPARDSSGFLAADPLYNTGIYQYGHVGGSLGAADATRFVGNLEPGQCNVQYWHFTYPRCSNNETPPCSGIPVWGLSNTPDDDLWLDFDVWATSEDGFSDNTTWTMTMRNEISAMANKIEPNPDGEWFNTNSDTVLPGETITTNGINYELGLVNKGFDNDGDFVPDYNAWLQPIGDASYDPACFRLVSTSGVITATRGGGQPDYVYPFTDQLYFTNLPSDNTGVTGKVFYTFLALNGPCSTSLTPYQEVASGYDNEKFNADFGTGIPPVGSFSPNVTIDKLSIPSSVPSGGGTFTYQIPFSNSGAADAGLTLGTSGVNMPLMIQDTVPAGLQYVGGSAAASLSYMPNTGVTIRYSTDSGASWSTTDPGTLSSTSPANLVMIQWWLNDPLPAGSAGSYATFQAAVPGSYTGSAFIENCAEIGFGDAASFGSACITSYVQGPNSLGDVVWSDSDLNGIFSLGESGISGITVSLYRDVNLLGVFEASDPFMGSLSTSSSGAYLFSNLPDGRYIVQVDLEDQDLPNGAFPTTTDLYYVILDFASVSPTGVVFTAADFGFGPALSGQKTLNGTDPLLEGAQVTYTLELTNNIPGSGTGEAANCTYTVWANAEDAAHSGTNGANSWRNQAGAFGSAGPDTVYAYSPYDNATNRIAGTGYLIGPHGSITKVEAVFSIYVAGTLVDDTARAYVYFNSTQLNDPIAQKLNWTSADLNVFNGQANQGLLTWDVTSSRNWTWADFLGNLDLRLDSARTSGTDNIYLYLDAMGFRITTDEMCGGSADTISPLPVTDTFDPTKLEFISASPAETSLVGGTISWADLGPLYAGQTKSITVSFKVLEPPDGDTDGESDPTTHQNCLEVTEATFSDGTDANDVTSCVTNNLNPTGSIGDTIWNDNGGPTGTGAASDGIQNGDEQGIPGVTVYLCTSSPCSSANDIAFTQTDSLGTYLFAGLSDGAYYVTVDTASLPGSTFTQTGDPDSICPSAGCNSSSSAVINNNNGNPADDDNLSRDFGYRIPNSILGSVWEDNNGDASPDLGENGLPGITVYVDNCGADAVCGNGDDGATLSVITDAQGFYTFSDLANGNYRIRLNTAPLAGYVNTFDPEGNNDSRSNVFSLTGGNTTGTFDFGDGPYDFGYYLAGSSSIGDTIYRDWNGDGAQQSAEEGIPGVAVYLYEDEDGDGSIDPDFDALLSSTMTDAAGSYLFDSLPAGSYIVQLDEGTLPSGFRQREDPDEAGVCSICDNASSVSGVDGTSSYLDHDFGYQPVGFGSIGDYIWQDTDADGIPDAAETPLANITVRLYEDTDGNGAYDSSVDALVASTQSDSAGYYGFNYLPAGNYLVDVDTSDADLPLDGFGQRYRLSTANDLLPVYLGTAESDLTVDFGFTTGGLIGDYVWQDNDGDGTQDSAETGIPNLQITLYRDVDSDGIYTSGIDTFYASDITDANGNYEFTSLPAGRYVVVGSGVSTLVLTGDPDGSAVPCTAFDCNNQAAVDLAAGQVDRSIDFGYQPQGNIGDSVWIDSNADGIRDAGETGLGNLTVYRCTTSPCSSSNAIASTSTDADGYYSFGNMADNTYFIAVDTADPDFLPGLAQSFDPDEGASCSVCDSQGAVTILGGSTDLTIDFGYRYSGANSIAGAVFHDDDDDAVQDTTETITYPGVTIYLWNSAGQLIASQETDLNGNYLFSSLPDGTFTVSLNPNAPNLSGAEPTITGSPTTYHTVSVAGGQALVDQDFGVLSNMDFGDLPATYNLTTLYYDGARHILASDPLNQTLLGSLIDPDPNGIANLSSSGDDSDADGDDEDGISPTIGAPWSTGESGGSIDVIVTGCPATCYLSGWIDWSGSSAPDYSFDQSGDRVLLDYPVVNGTQTIRIPVPSGIAFPNLFNARFRLYAESTDGYARPNGVVSNGEVEDLQFSFGPTAVSLMSFKAWTGVDLHILVTIFALLGACLIPGYLYSGRKAKKTG